MPVGTGGQSGEDDQDDGGDQKRIGSRPVVGQPAKGKLANDGAGKCDVTDIVFGGGGRIAIRVL